ncbi:MAG TPA: zinc-binding dehydrogenase, partial [Nakamurella sp.]
VGARVLTHSLPLRQQGAWAEQFIAAAEHVAVLPENVPFDVDAAFPVPGLTAEQSLGALDIRAGEQLLVHGAGGGDRLPAGPARLLRGAEVIATAGPRSTARVGGLGAAAILDHGEEHWVDRVRELSGGSGVPAAVNAAPSGARAVLRAVRDGGRLATITSDPPPAERDIALHTVYVKPDGAMLGRLADLCGRGAIGVPVGRPYRLEQAPAALNRVLEGTGGRAIVLAIG